MPDGAPGMVLDGADYRLWNEVPYPISRQRAKGAAMTPQETLISIARKYIGIKEGDPEINIFRAAMDGKANGEPWCAAFVSFCIKEAEGKLGRLADVIHSESCMEIWNSSPRKARVAKPEPGAIVIWNRVGTPFGHTGIVVGARQPETFASIEGNTMPGPGIEREGTGVYLKIHGIKGTMSYRIMGFLRPFQKA